MPHVLYIGYTFPQRIYFDWEVCKWLQSTISWKWNLSHYKSQGIQSICLLHLISAFSGIPSICLYTYIHTNIYIYIYTHIDIFLVKFGENLSWQRNFSIKSVWFFFFSFISYGVVISKNYNWERATFLYLSVKKNKKREKEQRCEWIRLILL